MYLSLSLCCCPAPVACISLGWGGFPPKINVCLCYWNAALILHPSWHRPRSWWWKELKGQIVDSNGHVQSYCFSFRWFQPLFPGETLKYKRVSLCRRVTWFLTLSRSSGLCSLPGKAENICITQLRSGALNKLRSTQYLFVQSLNTRHKGGFNNCNLEASNEWRRKVKWRGCCGLKWHPEYLGRLTRN